MIRSKGSKALNKVEKLLGWDRQIGMPIRQVAENLGITKHQLDYLLNRDYLSQKAKERRVAEKVSAKIRYVTHTSRKLRFSISLPKDWCVTTDTLEFAHVAQELLENILQQKSIKRPSGTYGCRVTEDGHMRPLTELEEWQAAKQEHENKIANAEQHSRLERLATGLFQAELPNHKDEAFVEITKLRLDGPMDALDLYKLDKYLPEDVAWGNRPSKGMVVDGLSGVVYYHMMRYSISPRSEPVFFRVYLADGLEGWILSCDCRHGDKTFEHYKPIFKRIIKSFRRIRTISSEEA